MRTVAIDRWRFTLADEVAAATKGHDDASWREVAVPHDWSVEADFSREWSSGTGYLPGGIGWYRAHVSLAALGAAGDQHVRLVFHGVYKNADVWVNGYHLGGRPSGHTAFSFDLTEIVSYAPDDDLVVSVRVDHADISDSRWYNGSGITRRVELEVHESVRVAEHGTIVTTTAADAAVASVRIDQTLVNEADEPVVVAVRHELRSLTSGRVQACTAEVQIPPRGDAVAESGVELAHPDLWSDAAPHLYRVTTTLTWTLGAVEHTATGALVTGIRVFRFDPDHGFSINGERRVLKGVCLHEDAGSFGVAVPVEVWLRRLLSLKDMGCNAVRMAHNPHAPELYALCDALGFYVIDEAFDEWENPKNKWWQGHNVYPPRHEGYAHDFPDWHERDLVAMVRAHRHHPSIIAWSIGNEVDYPNDPYASPLFAEMTGNNDANKPAAERVYDPARPDVRRLTTIARRLAAIVRREDPTRPTTLAAAFPELSSRTGLLDAVDLIGYNYKEHLYADDHRRFPRTPFVGSENGHGYRQWRAVVDDEFVAGQFLWTGIDYLGEARGWPVHGSGAGVLTLAGFEKPTWHLRRSWWSDDPVAHLATRPQPAAGTAADFWSDPVGRGWDAEAPGPVEVLCFANGDAVRLTGDGAEIPVTFDEHRGYGTALVPPQIGALVLETLRGGQVVARDELAPRAPAVRLDVEVWRAPADAVRRCADAGLRDDGVVQLVCTLRDEHGALAAADDRLVEVEIDGGRLLGLENGDLGDVTPYRLPHRRTLDGRLMVFVRAASTSPATVRIRAAGLAEVELGCSAQVGRT